VGILRGFLKSDELGSCGSQALGFQQQVIQISITSSAPQQGFDVAVHSLNDG
jgi:hypothetical protein